MRAESWIRLSPRFRTAVARLPQTAPAVRLAQRVTGGDLRVLGMHGVPDLAQFDRVLREVLRVYTPVTETEVVAALAGHQELPDLAVWFTFDDGLRSTLDAGELLAHHGVSATVFVCPAVIGRTQRLWFESAAMTLYGETPPGPEDTPSVSRLKLLPDAERRAIVEELESSLPPVDPETVVHVEDLRAWRALGHTIGNHTWDHPCLDTCSEGEQKRQVLRAHEALVEWGFRPRFFAYPNGNFTRIAAETAQDLGYAGSLLFDHRLSGNLAMRPHGISRLRMDSDVDTRRAWSILSGAHSFAHHLVLER